MDLMTEELEPGGAPASGRDMAAQLAASGALDELFARINAGEVDMTNSDGLVPGLIKAALERGLQAEPTNHLGYEKSAPEASVFPNSRNGSTSKTVSSHVGPVELGLAIVTWIERTYHRRRHHARVGRLTPVEFDMIQSTQAATAV